MKEKFLKIRLFLAISGEIIHRILILQNGESNKIFRKVSVRIQNFSIPFFFMMLNFQSFYDERDISEDPVTSGNFRLLPVSFIGERKSEVISKHFFFNPSNHSYIDLATIIVPVSTVKNVSAFSPVIFLYRLIYRLSLIILEQRQYKNDLVRSRTKLILKLPHFFTQRTFADKAHV